MKMKIDNFDDYINANRKGSRDAELEDKTGWTAKNKKHKTLKDYSRKGKNKLRKFVEEEDMYV
jgi:hypothetical protein